MTLNVYQAGAVVFGAIGVLELLRAAVSYRTGRSDEVSSGSAGAALFFSITLLLVVMGWH